ncbi:hypothetical protein AAC691_11205 [Nguyenibacter vanlangensis]|uniref:Uncharacterized protein n=1 Tax=Nguyenibacter vanlangensis TaxID=1216886 RepID=A0ABZ3CZH9_9PROT
MVAIFSLKVTNFRTRICEHADALVYRLWCERICQSGVGDEAFTKGESFEPVLAGDAAEVLPMLLRHIDELQAEGILTAIELNKISAAINAAIESLDENVVEKYLEIFNVFDDISDAILPARPSSVVISSDGNLVTYSIAEGAGETDFVRTVQRMTENAVIKGEALLPTERAAVLIAGNLLDGGYRLPIVPISWGMPGFRKHQSVMSVTDPGPGHLFDTVTDLAHMEGVIVHIEHLERGVAIPRAEVEPYRIPMPRIVPRICLQAARFAPVSTYVGRPLFEGTFDNSFLKTVHTFAAACSEFFGTGVTECKVAIEGMTYTQAVRFMRAMVANTRRAENQILSGAFCINVPIIDDRDANNPRTVSDPFEVGRLGIDIVIDGHFEKVTWDGTADSYPSKCVIDQIEFWQSATLVHEAHERGLLTYFSAGFRMHNLEKVVYTGVDGVGIGGAQILRFMDYTTGNHGPFKGENIRPILDLRNNAETSVRGKAARLLAKLDTLHFLDALDESQENFRHQFFEAVCSEDIDKIAVLLRNADTIGIGSAERRTIWRRSNFTSFGDAIAERRRITRPSIFFTSVRVPRNSGSDEFIGNDQRALQTCHRHAAGV